MSENRKKPVRRSVKKETEKARAKQKHIEKPRELSAQSKKPLQKKTMRDAPVRGISQIPDDKKRKGDLRTGLHWPQILFALFLVLAVVLAALFSWDRWLRYDDARDVQGEWTYTFGENSVPVSIDSDRIAFASDVKFEYTIDAWEKTLEFSFTDLSGKGFYRFSLDRKTLYVSESATEDVLVSIQVSLGMTHPSAGMNLETTTILTKGVSTPLPESLSNENGVPKSEDSSGSNSDEKKGAVNDVGVDNAG